MTPRHRVLAILVLCAVCGSSSAEESEYSYFDTESRAVTPVEVDAGTEPCAATGRYRMDRSARAGGAHRAGWWAVPGTNNRYYAAGYVGGGAVVHGDGPALGVDGTWGLDYVGIVVPKRVFLNWWHGRKFQGGAGAYQTDGPKIEHE